MLNNWERTITIVSTSQLLSISGWRIGWAIGPQRILYYGGIVAVTIYECWNTPGQIALGKTLGKLMKEPFAVNKNGEKVSLIDYMKDRFETNRDFITRELSTLPLPLKPIPIQGGHFFMLDVGECRSLIPTAYLEGRPTDLAFCLWIAKEAGVMMSPCSDTYGRSSTDTRQQDYVRFALTNIDQLLEAMRRLRAHFCK